MGEQCEDTTELTQFATSVDFVCPSLSEDLAQLICAQYGDLLRVGKLNVNGRRVKWDPCGCAARALANFVVAFVEVWTEAMTELEDPDFGFEVVGELIFWICKALSLNYCIREVVALLQTQLHVEEPLSLQTYDNEAQRPLLKYLVDAKPKDGQIHVKLLW